MNKSSSMNRLRRVVRSQFEQDFGRSLHTVKSELHKEFGQPNPQAAANRARMVGIFVGVAAARRGLTLDALAQSTGLNSEDVQALVQGTLPEDSYSDSLLTRLSHAIGYEVDLLRMMLGRTRVGA
jgi:hypothetical protein